MNDFVKVVEVGPRDGLQNEPRLVQLTIKLDLIERLVASGLKVIEATSFVSPKWIPQLADADELYPRLEKRDDVAYPVLVPNAKGLERALKVGARAIAVFTAASEAFNQRNINCSIDESIDRFIPVLERAREENLWVRGYVSCVLGCPYQQQVDVSEVVRVSRRLHEIGCDEISLGDTIGVGTPHRARAMLRAVAGEVPLQRLAVHFHDSYGQAVANLLACIEEGVRIVDSSVAGLGGCPYAKGASGNVASEDVVYLLHGLGLQTGIDLERLAHTGQHISDLLDRRNQSRAGSAIVKAQSK
ncbi:MAG: hydroxymethylglutaryl-CoA lyase [Wenzhouxiangellaceae bacterium]